MRQKAVHWEVMERGRVLRGGEIGIQNATAHADTGTSITCMFDDRRPLAVLVPSRPNPDLAKLGIILQALGENLSKLV